MPTEPVAETRAGDVPVYFSDCAKLFEFDQWRPRRDPRRVLADVHDWIAADEERIGQALGIVPAGAGGE